MQAVSAFDDVLRFDPHVLRQPIENVGAMPADWFAAVGTPLRKAPED
jgi:hypothetical protein